MSERERLRLPMRVGFALAVALMVGLGQYVRVSSWPAPHGLDYDSQWRAARALLSGLNPYTVITSDGPYPRNQGLHYPLWSVLPTLPLGLLRIETAVAAFTALMFGLMAYAVAGTPWLAVLFSFPASLSFRSAQWSPAMVAAALLPSLTWISVVKPQVGIAVLAYRAPQRRTTIMIVTLVAVSFVLVPSWPLGWLREVSSGGMKSAPITWLGGPLLLLSALRWRTPEGRLLLVLSLVPTSPWWYDAVVLWLCARSSREALAMTVCSWAAGVAMLFVEPFPLTLNSATEFRTAYGPYAIAGAYLPALVFVLRRRNEGSVHPLVERLVSLLPVPLRGIQK